MNILALCLYTESQYVSVRHTEENGYMFLTFFHPPLHVFVLCLAFIRRLFFLSFTLFD